MEKLCFYIVALPDSSIKLFWFRGLDFGSDCTSSWSLLTFLLFRLTVMTDLFIVSSRLLMLKLQARAKDNKAGPAKASKTSACSPKPK